MIVASILVMAVIPVSHPEISDSVISKLQKEVVREIKQDPTSTESFLSMPDCRRLFERELKEELERAWADYYEFHWAESLRRLEGRADPEALALRALIHWGKGEGGLADERIRLLIQSHGSYRFNPSQFPPAFLERSVEIQREPRANRRLKLRTILGFAVEPEAPLNDWGERLARLVAAGHATRVVLVGLEPAGAFHRIVGLSVQSRLAIPFELRLESLDDLPRAARTLVKTANLVDTP